MNFKQLRSNITQHLKDRRQNIADNPRSVDYILMKLDSYVDIIYKEIQEAFPLGDLGVIQQIENSLTRPQQREIEPIETSISIKNKLVGIANELENELRGFERECGSFYFDYIAFRRYKHNAISLMENEYDFLFEGTCLQSKIGEINNEHRRIESTNSSNTRTLRGIYESFKSGSVINHFKEKAERDFFKKVDEVIDEYKDYLLGFVQRYEEKWLVVKAAAEPKSESNSISMSDKEALEDVQVSMSPFEEDLSSSVLSTSTKEIAEMAVSAVDVPITTRDQSEIDEDLQSSSAFDLDYLFPKEPEQKNNRKASSNMDEEESNQPHIATLTITYGDGEIMEYTLSSEREKLWDELEELLLKM